MSTSGGVGKAIERGETIGCTAIQVFVKGNTRWQFPPLKDADIESFHRGMERGNVRSVIAHSIYLVNLASNKPDILQKSIDDMVDELSRCEVLGIPGVVMHPGSHVGQGEEVGLNGIVAALNVIFEQTADMKAQVLLETTAGQGTNLGAKFEHLAYIIGNVKQPHRLGVCLDTCHVFAAGYDLRAAEDYARLWTQFDAVIGRDRLKAIHLNDSKFDCGSRKDRHEHIGKGYIGLDGFRHIMNDASLINVPMVLETEKDADMAEDVENMNVLRSLVG